MIILPSKQDMPSTAQESMEAMLLLVSVRKQLHSDYELYDLPTVSKEDKELLNKIFWQKLKHWNLKTGTLPQSFPDKYPTPFASLVYTFSLLH